METFDNMNIYDQPSDVYDATLSDDYVQKFYAPIRNLVAKHVTSAGASVLDLCCGTGVIAEMLVELPDITYTGVDINRPFLDTAQERMAEARNFTFLQADVMRFEPDEKADIVLLVNAYHHLENSRKSEFLHNIHQLLSPKGVLIVYEMLVAKFLNSREFSNANEEFYLQRIEWIKQHETMSEKKLQAWTNLCALSMKSEEEHKVYYEYIVQDFVSNGFVIAEEHKMWPDEGTEVFDDQHVGDYIFVLKKTA
ncbi:methyltransferase domain-containing protein [Desulfobacterales bacterium HSG2]|nr:methyltransferase domain-containing protein [Desulfobacterales bacterium HSG2]